MLKIRLFYGQKHAVRVNVLRPLCYVLPELIWQAKHIRYFHRLKAQRILKDKTHPSNGEFSVQPCCRLARDTEVSAAVLPDLRAAFSLRL